MRQCFSDVSGPNYIKWLGHGPWTMDHGPIPHAWPSYSRFNQSSWTVFYREGRGGDNFVGLPHHFSEVGERPV